MKTITKFVRKITKKDQQTALIVLSFPKSGRTWHRVTLGHYLAQEAGMPSEMAMDLKKLTRKACIGQIRYTHNGTNFINAEHHNSPSVCDPDEWTGEHTLLIVRDPRDVLVSAFYHSKYRIQNFDGDISQFIRSTSTGIDKILTALNKWHNNRHLARSFDVISYEEMHARPQNALATTLSALKISPRTDRMQHSIEFSQFDRMKEYERTNMLNDARMAPRGHAELGAKVRTGRYGSYVDEFSLEDLEYMEERIRQIGDPFSKYYEV